MAYKKIRLGIPVLVLVLAMMVIGCDGLPNLNGNTTGENGDSTTGGNGGGTTGENGDDSGSDTTDEDGGSTTGENGDNTSGGDEADSGGDTMDGDGGDDSGSNPLSGRVYFSGQASSGTLEKITFSTTADGSKNGRYVITTVDSGTYEPGEKYTFNTEKGNGSYSWNDTLNTVTLKPERIAGIEDTYYFSNAGTEEIGFEYGALMDRDSFRPYVETIYDDVVENTTQEEFEDLLALTGFSSRADLIDYSVEEAFSNKSYTYSFDTDKTVLFLEAVLPDNKGVNELIGGTWHHFSDQKRQFTFTDSGYIYTDQGATIKGSYAYDSSKKRVWLQSKTINGKSRTESYESLTTGSSHRFPDDYAARACETNASFSTLTYYRYYMSEDNTLWW